MVHDEEDYYEHRNDAETGADLGHWLEEVYAGDARFEMVELDEEGQLDGEDFRLRFVVDSVSHFFVAVMSDQGFVRVGLSTEDVDVSEMIEKLILDSGHSMTEFLEEAIGTSDEIEYEVQHFHDDEFYFSSDVPYESGDQLASQAFRDEIIYYLDGYIDALSDALEGSAE